MTMKQIKPMMVYEMKSEPGPDFCSAEPVPMTRPVPMAP